jgi:hypothetical protein
MDKKAQVKEGYLQEANITSLAENSMKKADTKFLFCFYFYVSFFKERT